MQAEALKLYRDAIKFKDPHGFISRWLAQDLTPHCCAIAILALHQLTGRLYVHPATPEPDFNQRIRTPEVWRTAVQLVRRHDPNLDNVKVGQEVHMPGSRDKVERFLMQNDPIKIDERPDSGIVSDWQAAIKPRYTAEDIAQLRKRGGGPPTRRFIKPKKRGEGAVGRFSSV